MEFTVYLLKRNNKIVYIGQSKNVKKRRQRAGIPPPLNTKRKYKQYDEVIEWRTYSTRYSAVKEEDILQHAFKQKFGHFPEYNRGCSLRCKDTYMNPT